jgi:hypothetical protein
MWATQDELSNDVADFLFFIFLNPPPPSSRVVSPTNGFYQTNTSNLHTQSHEPFFFFLFLGVFFYLLNPESHWYLVR